MGLSRGITRILWTPVANFTTASELFALHQVFTFLSFYLFIFLKILFCVVFGFSSEDKRFWREIQK